MTALTEGHLSLFTSGKPQPIFGQSLALAAVVAASGNTLNGPTHDTTSTDLFAAL